MSNPSKSQVAARLLELKNEMHESPEALHNAMSEAFGLIIAANPNALYEMFFDYMYSEGFGVNEENFDRVIERVEQ